jgi:16S rRNA (uracil1498-N3)-methyltransferase
MYQFFVNDDQISDTAVTIIGADVNHIRNVLRFPIGEQIRISSTSGADYYCEITNIEKEKITTRILYQDHEKTELPIKIYLFQGLPKGDKMEFIIQKAVELGVYEIIPVAMKNCVVKWDEKKAAAKVRRYQTIAEGAAKQARRCLIPTVHERMFYQEALRYAQGFDRLLLPYENASGMQRTREILADLKPESTVAIFIGPEGGFDQTEIALAEPSAEIISLGKRILRTETAGMALLAMLLYQLED